MELTVSLVEGSPITLIALNGRLDIMGTNEVELKFNSYASASNGPVVVDLSKVTFMSSIGLRLLISNAQALKKKGQRMVLFGADSLIGEVLATSGISNAIPVVDTLDQASQAVKLPLV